MTSVIRQRLIIQISKGVCSIHISVLQNSQAKVMKKVMGEHSKKKFKFRDTPLLPSPTTFSKGAFEGKQSFNSKRATVLNKLFMRYITDLMATGECPTKFVGHGIEINRVQITPDFNCVNIFWIARGTENDDVIENILQKNIGSLRHELAQLKIVGVIPKLRFVKDKEYARSVEVDRLLAEADFGEDYVPVDITIKLKANLELNTTLEPHIVKQIHELDDDKSITQYEEPLPPMPNNVFGLDYSEIMAHVQKSKKKSQALHRLEPEEDVQIPQSVNENPIQYTSAQEEREAFKQFLQKRQILKDKAKRIDKNYRPELEYLEEEWLKQGKLNSNYDANLNDDADFIDDDDNEK